MIDEVVIPRSAMNSSTCNKSGLFIVHSKHTESLFVASDALYASDVLTNDCSLTQFVKLSWFISNYNKNISQLVSAVLFMTQVSFIYKLNWLFHPSDDWNKGCVCSTELMQGSFKLMSFTYLYHWCTVWYVGLQCTINSTKFKNGTIS